MKFFLIIKYEKLTFDSQENEPFLIETAGSPGSRGGFGKRILSSAKRSSSSRFKDTFAFTAYQRKTKLESQVNEVRPLFHLLEKQHEQEHIENHQEIFHT